MSGSSRRPTLSTVAQRCGYSVNTVSRALRGDSRLPQSTIQKIREAADEVGYIPNRLAASLRSSESHVVAIIIEDIENPHYSHLMARIELELQARGYNVIILCNNRSLTTEKELAALAVSYSVSGVLLFPQDSVGTADGNSSAVQLLQTNHIPVVIVDRAIQQQDIDCVRVDDEAGGYLAGKTLAQLGHQKYLYLAGPQNNTSQPLRQEGFLRAVDEFVSSDQKSVRIIENTISCQALHEGRITRLLTPLNYSALVCFNDEVAYDCMQALQEEGYQIPQDLSICGFDSIGSDIRFLPRLSSIAHAKGYSIAEYAVKALMNRIEHPAAARQDIVLPVSYYDGGTCAGPVRLHRRPSDV